MSYYGTPYYGDGKGWSSGSVSYRTSSTPTTIESLFPNLSRHTIGDWNALLGELQSASKSKTGYPPYDILELEDDKFVVNVAVAGFRREDIIITTEPGTLTIAGSFGLKEDKEEEEESKFIHNGIARRDFTLNFLLAEHIEVEGATLEEGVLSVSLFKNIPEEKRTKVIDIK